MDPQNPPGGRIIRGHDLRLAPSATALIAAAVLDAIQDAGLPNARDTVAPPDIIILAVPTGKGNGALNVALRAVELDLQGDGAELERRLYA